MSLGKGIFSSFIGVLFGLALFGGSFPLLFWNENRSVQTERSLAEGQKVLLRADTAERDRANEGKLIYVSGDAKPSAPIVDDRTNLRPPALVAKRESEMYQWDETKRTTGSGNAKVTHYDYDRKWVGHLENSADFHERAGHENPTQFKAPSATFTTPTALLGAWQIPAAILSEIDPNQHWLPAEKELKGLPPTLAPLGRLAGDYLYFAQDPSTPKIGDERVKYHIVPVGPISVIGRQTGAALSEYHTSNGRKLVLAEAGAVSAETMFEHAFTHNRILSWVLRGAGALVMFIGIRLLVEPLTALTDWIPFIGGIIDSGATLASGILALGGSAITIAVAWFAVRPMLSGGLVLGVAGLIWLFRKKSPRAVPNLPR